MRKFIPILATAALAAAPALADTTVRPTVDLNVRSGAGSSFGVVGSIPAGTDATAAGCATSGWCQVSHDGTTGWAYGEYLQATVDGKTVTLLPDPAAAGVAVIEAEVAPPPAEAPTTGTATTGTAAPGTPGSGVATAGAPEADAPAATGSLVVRSADGNIVAIEPTSATQTYVQANTQPPVILDGEVVVGAGVPDTVTLYDIPDQPDLKYVTINGQVVLVSPSDRRIVYIYR